MSSSSSSSNDGEMEKLRRNERACAESVEKEGRFNEERR